MTSSVWKELDGMESMNWERDWYDVFEADGELMVRYRGFAYWGEDVGSGPGRRIEVADCVLPYAEFYRWACVDRALADMCEPYRQHIDDMTEGEYAELIGDDGTTRMQFWELTPDGAEPGSYHSVILDLESANVLDAVLEDDSAGIGGTAHVGGTVADFLLSCDPMPETVGALNEALVECGIRPVEPRW